MSLRSISDKVDHLYLTLYNDGGEGNRIQGSALFQTRPDIRDAEPQQVEWRVKSVVVPKSYWTVDGNNQRLQFWFNQSLQTVTLTPGMYDAANLVTAMNTACHAQMSSWSGGNWATTFNSVTLSYTVVAPQTSNFSWAFQPLTTALAPDMARMLGIKQVNTFANATSNTYTSGTCMGERYPYFVLRGVNNAYSLSNLRDLPKVGDGQAYIQGASSDILGVMVPETAEPELGGYYKCNNVNPSPVVTSIDALLNSRLELWDPGMHHRVDLKNQPFSVELEITWNRE